MQRDMDLARRILFTIENDSGGPSYPVSLDLGDQYPPDVVAYHVMLLKEAGLIEAQLQQTSSNFHAIPQRLTWAGHEFLDAARDDNIWERAKKETIKATGGLSVDLLKGVLLKLAVKALEIE